ncbi:DUF2029 domain-containing protein [Sphingomonas sp. SUN019]|uniref:DUF2029 domain-containing protein n=1 Tax=Sphingomonas sp. SUN019 TaxID=2937788 RepID=UPI002164BB10|nr:DUF2029 domain-containing protein [Sphingomonas sp. SUN019]UVO51360.1 DUF2029 domain-containing protein [Sphingomonas sp. SUN019]
MMVRAIDRYRLLILLLVAVAARAATFGDPVVHVDEDFYFAAADAMWRGAVPYLDVWDRKPVGLFLLYMPPAALPFWWGIWAYQAMALGAVVGTAWIVGRIAMRAGWGRGATLAGVAYILWLNVAGGQGGQSPVFYNFPMAAAALLIVSNPARRWWRDAAAMALVGTALTIKTSAVFEGAFFGLWIIVHDWRNGRAPMLLAMRAVGLAALAFAPTAGIVAYYRALGALDAFWFANLWSIMGRNSDPPHERWGNLAKLVLLLSPLAAMAFAARGTAAGGTGEGRRFAILWAATALFGVFVIGGWFDHYALPAVAPLAVCAARFLGARFWGARRGAGLAILGVVALAGQITIVVNRVMRGGPGEFAALATAVGRGPGCLWVYSGTTKLYPATGRCRVTRYVFPSHLYRTRETGAIGVDQEAEVRRVLAVKPAVIVMRPLSIGERPEIRAIVIAAVARDYRLAARTPLGNEMISVFKRR